MHDRTVVPKRFWHYAVSSMHQRVAVAAFLRAAEKRGASVYYLLGEDIALLVQDVAHQLGRRLLPVPTDAAGHRLALIARPWWCIVTHNTHAAMSGCPMTWSIAAQPEVSLCLGVWREPSLAEIPDGHRAYITGQRI
jgi:hypothetical protein